MIELSLTMFMRSTGGARNRKTLHFLGKNSKPPQKPHQLIQPQKRIWIDSEAKKIYSFVSGAPLGENFFGRHLAATRKYIYLYEMS